MQSFASVKRRFSSVIPRYKDQDYKAKRSEPSNLVYIYRETGRERERESEKEREPWKSTRSKT